MHRGRAGQRTVRNYQYATVPATRAAALQRAGDAATEGVGALEGEGCGGRWVLGTGPQAAAAALLDLQCKKAKSNAARMLQKVRPRVIS